MKSKIIKKKCSISFYDVKQESHWLGDETSKGFSIITDWGTTYYIYPNRRKRFLSFYTNSFEKIMEKIYL